MNIIFLLSFPLIFVFLSLSSYYQKIENGHNQQDAKDAGNNANAVFAIAPPKEDAREEDSIRAVYTTYDPVHDHNDQTIANPKRKKWRISKHRVFHGSFNFFRPKTPPQFRREARIPGRRNREPRYNSKYFFPDEGFKYSNDN